MNYLPSMPKAGLCRATKLAMLEIEPAIIKKKLNKYFIHFSHLRKFREIT